jgi:hypothetical protein
MGGRPFGFASPPIWFCEITKEKQNETQKQVGVRQLAFAKWKRTFAEE